MAKLLNKQDVSDYLENHSKDELIELCNSFKDRNIDELNKKLDEFKEDEPTAEQNQEDEIPKVINPNDFLIINKLADVKNMPPPKKLLGNLLVEGDVAIIAGNSNIGKSVFCYQLASALSRGVSYGD